VAEFPGTKTGGLTLNVDGKLFDKPTGKYLSTDLYKFTHFDPSCTGEVSLTPVRLSKEEAIYLGRFIKRTPPIDPSIPLSEFGPGKGSIFKRGAQEEKSSMSDGQFAGHSPISVLGQLLGEPYAMQSWLPTAQGHQTALMEMVNLMRAFLQFPAPREKERSADGSEANAFMSRTAAAVDLTSPQTQVSASLRAQWRDALMPLLKGAFFDAHDAIDELATADSFPSISSKRALQSILALQVLGGLSESIHNGSKVQVRVGDSLITGVVQHFDPLLSTVSVAVKRALADDGVSTDKTGGDSAAQQQQAADVDVATLLQTLGLTNDVSSGFLGVFEFPVDQVVPISPSLPPPLSSLGSAADFLRQACRLLTMQLPSGPPVVDEERKSGEVDRAAAVGMRHSIHELILAQAQHHLLLVLMHYLPAWLHAGSELSDDVLQLLSVSLDRWHSSPVSTQLSLHPHEWATVARFTSQRLSEEALKMQQDPVYARRQKLADQLTSPESQATANIISDGARGTSNVAPTVATSTTAASAASSVDAPDSSSRTTALALTRANAAFVLHPESDSDDESSSALIPITVSNAPPPMPPLLQNLDRLTSMGFPSVACRFALASTRGNLEASISVILERLNEDEAEVDENMANASFESTIDRLGQRDAVDAYRSWQENQSRLAALRQAEAVVGGGAPIAPPLAGSGGPSMKSPNLAGQPGVKIVSEAERRLVAVAPHIHMANRYSYWDEDPLEALALAAPFDNAMATSRALNTTATRPAEYTMEQDKMKLLASAKAGTLIGAELFIPPDAFEATIGTRVGVHTAKKFPYKVGDTLTIIDLVNKVCPAVVDDINEETNKIFLHYIGWCMDPRTEVVLHNGAILPMSKLESHHRLIGDDGRTHVDILPDTLDHTPRGRMVKIVPASDQFESVLVTENHVLTIIGAVACQVQRRVDELGSTEWYVTQINSVGAGKLAMIEVASGFASSADAAAFARQLDVARFADPPRYDLTLTEYMQFDESIKSSVMMFRPSPMQPQTYDAADSRVWREMVGQVYSTLTHQSFDQLPSDVQLQLLDRCGWLVGFSLGRGDTSHLVGDGDDLAVIFHSRIPIIVASFFSILPSVRSLQAALLTVDPSVRRNVLAGLIDAAGSFDDGAGVYTLLADDEATGVWYRQLASQLGFAAGAVVAVDRAYACQITGLSHHLQMLPIQDVTKQCKKTTIVSASYPYGCAFTIEPAGVSDAADPSASLDHQPYVSFSVSGNERFLLANGLVCHNSKKWDEVRITCGHRVGDLVLGSLHFLTSLFACRVLLLLMCSGWRWTVNVFSRSFTSVIV
jgi:hypothetical protein